MKWSREEEAWMAANYGKVSLAEAAVAMRREEMAVAKKAAALGVSGRTRGRRSRVYERSGPWAAKLIDIQEEAERLYAAGAELEIRERGGKLAIFVEVEA